MLFFLIPFPAVAADSLCPCDNLDYCVEWVSEGTVTMKWGQLGKITVDGTEYKFRPDDFNADQTGVLISAQRGTEDVLKEFLFESGDNSFHWDNDVLVELEDISVGSQETPVVKLELFSRGLPELDFEFEASSEEIDGVSVEEDQYAPGEEKLIEVTVKNTGGAWIENVVLEVDMDEFRLKSKEDFEFRDQVIRTNLGCLGQDDSKSINFTVIAPEWDGKTSPYSINYNITAKAGGYDIKGDYHSFEEMTSFGCTEPEIKVKLKVVNEEINMSSWFVRPLYSKTDKWQSVDFEIWNAWEHSFLRTNIYNMGLYTVDDLDVQFSEIPEGLMVSETHESGDYERVSPEGQYYLGQKLIPIESGSYTFPNVVVTANFYGKNFTWKSDSQSLKVHGPHILFSKSLAKSDDGYAVTLKVSNDGDRPSWVNITDKVPPEANYMGGSLEENLKGEVPLAEWDWSSSRVNGTQIISVDGVLLAPGESFSFGYGINPGTAPDLPYATCEFRGIPDYEDEIQSSSFVLGAEVKRYFDLSTGEWINDTEDLQVSSIMTASSETEDAEEEPLHSYEEDAELMIPDTSLEVPQENANPSFLSKLLGPLAEFFTKAQQFVHNLLQGILGGFGSAFGTMEGMAINAVENYLYAIVIIIALAVFGIVYTLISR
ncbi:MAG: hypothetical protein SCH66_11890 [Methanolobus sp.]|nr:hypothetical protein [Methanolobus sp.]